jgi:DNA-binding NtrC family response regulator
MRIIVVDDDPAFRDSLAEVLRDDGHAVDTYASAEAVPGTDALPDVAVLITDYQMPGRDGMQLADTFHVGRPDTPVIMVSAHDTAALERQAAHRYWLVLLPKTVDYGRLHALIHQLCGARRPA